MQTKEVFLYPGFLAKSEGKILWFSEKPIFLDGIWFAKNFVDVTSCIFDPWPYYSGDENSIIKVEMKNVR